MLKLFSFTPRGIYFFTSITFEKVADFLGSVRHFCLHLDQLPSDFRKKKNSIDEKLIWLEKQKLDRLCFRNLLYKNRKQETGNSNSAKTENNTFFLKQQNLNCIPFDFTEFCLRSTPNKTNYKLIHFPRIKKNQFFDLEESSYTLIPVGSSSNLTIAHDSSGNSTQDATLVPPLSIMFFAKQKLNSIVGKELHHAKLKFIAEKDIKVFLCLSVHRKFFR